MRKYFCEVDGYRSPKDAVLTKLPENDYVEQYRYLELFYKEYVGEELMSRFITFINRKNKYPTKVIDVRHQVDHISSKKFQLFEEFDTDPANVNARLFVIKVRQRQMELKSDVCNVIEIKVT